MRKIFVSIAIALISFTLNAQEIKVKSFEHKSTDLEAKLNPVYDINGDACALLRINTSSKDVVFEGNIIGKPMWDNGEWLVYLPKASESFKIKAKGFAPATYVFEDTIESYHAYEMELQLIPKERFRALIMPTLSFRPSSHLVYGIRAGFVKRFGGFIHAKSDLQFGLKTVGVCDEGGYVDGSQAWLTGKEQQSRWAITAGGIANIWKPIYAYLGAGYGIRTLAWENTDGEYYKVAGSSYNGIEADAGFIFRIGFFSISAGVQTNSFKLWETVVGIGVMF